MPDETEPVNLSPTDPSAAPPEVPENPAVLVHAEHWIAPLPPPADLQMYENVLPGAAERIFSMAENQQQYTSEQVKAYVNQEHYALETARITHAADSSRSKLGLIFAFIIALAGLGIGAALTFVGAGGFGLLFLFVPLSSLVGVFIYTDRTRRAERRRNLQDDETD